MRRAGFIAMCVALVGVLPASGQEERGRGPEQGARDAVWKLSDLMSTRVTVERGRSLGKVVDLVINEGGCVDYLIVSYEDDLLPVPWGVVTYHPAERVVL